MTKALNAAAWAVVVCLLVACIAPVALTRDSWAQQHRNDIDAAPSVHYPLGADDLGRNRFTRLVYGARTSLLLAAAAALLATCIAGLVGGAAGWVGGRLEKAALWGTDLFLSLPWLFLILTVRALLPLNTSPEMSVAITFLLLGALGWAAPARVVRARVRTIAGSDYVLQARACGLSGARVFLKHVAPGMRPVLAAQFFVSLPLFVLSEANLGALGLGVSEPLPSLGALLRELQDYSLLGTRPWATAPAVALSAIVLSLYMLFSRREVNA